MPVYSSDYSTANLSNPEAYQSIMNGIFLGYKWQCVEFVRRWLYINQGYLFENIAMAYQIFSINHLTRVATNTRLAVYSFKQGSLKGPEPGCILVWDQGGDFEKTGHVAIISAVREDCVFITEQNGENKIWPKGQNYSRVLQYKINKEKQCWIEDPNENNSILGWVCETNLKNEK